MRTLRPPRSGRRTRPRLHRPRRRRWSRRMTPPSPRRPSPSRRPTTVGSTPRRSDADGAPTCQVCSRSAATRPAPTTAAGPFPTSPRAAVAVPADGGGLCSTSTDQHGARVWCGTGWTGQPAVFERDGRHVVVFGAYDPPSTSSTRPPASASCPTSRPATSSRARSTIDPDGYPARLHGVARQLLPGDRDRPRQAHRAVGAERQRRVADEVEQRLGRRRRSSSTTTSSRAARTASSTS